MGSRQYIIPVNAMTLTDQQNYRITAVAAGIQRAIELGIGTWDKTELPNPDPKNPKRPDLNGIKALLGRNLWPRSLDVRDFQPIIDAGAVLDQWLTAALAVIGTQYSALQAVGTFPINLRANKLVVFYKIAVPVATFPVSRLIFRNNAGGNTLAQYDLEPLIAQETPEGYLSEPFVIDPNMTFAVQVMASVVSAAAKVVLGNLVFEPTGQTNA